MQRKKLDSRIRTLIDNGVKTRNRSFFVVVGDHGKDQIMYLHFMLSKARVANKPSVLWCYKKELGFTSHRKKRMRHHQAMVKKGLKDADTEDPFELFIAGTNIRYCYYKESEKILGNTYGMCVLQDFEALTPNLLARTVETVEGGGIVVLLLRTMTSLKQLYTMTMDVHSRYRTESHEDVVGRFNERFILSLGNCDNCLVLDDELNILPLSKSKSIAPINQDFDSVELTPAQKELTELKESLKDTLPVSALINQAKTLDQGKAVLTFIEAISEKSLRSTVTLTAARGRGKSAALGIAIAAAVAYGYSNIFVTSPSPENLKTLFEFIFKTFDALGYEEHLDYDIVQSTNPAFNKAIVRVNIFRDHRQTIQYIQPQDAKVLGQAELVVIDEAAAIPLPLVRQLLGPYLVFMASTINGYEGTGRSLSLKLIQQLREQSSSSGSSSGGNSLPATIGVDEKKSNEKGSAPSITGRSLREIKLEEPIRYAANDATERWLNKLLCLDAAIISRSNIGCPHPSECELYFVNRDTLFSYHPVSEAFLQRMMALYVASHYKNSPNDLQLMSDAPAHQLFVLLPPIKDDSVLPEPLAVVQVCLEGEISKASVMASLSRGKKADGDLIPWTVAQQYQDDDFASLSGARVVRIATHPDYTRMGYGGRALELLTNYYEGKIACLAENDTNETAGEEATKAADLLGGKQDALHSETLQIRDSSKMPPLLSALADVRAPNLDWLGVSYGVTADLLRFWKRGGFVPVYIRQTPNELTGEHSCIMLRSLAASSMGAGDWLSLFWLDFKKRFLSLLSYQFRDFSPALALSVLETKVLQPQSSRNKLSREDLERDLSPYDLKRLESYGNNMLDYHVIMDLLPKISNHYFMGLLDGKEGDSAEPSSLESVSLSAVQRAILAGVGLQRKSVDELSGNLNLPAGQVLALFIRIVRKAVEFYRSVKTREILHEAEKKRMDGGTQSGGGDGGRRAIGDDEAWDPTEQSLEAEMEEAADETVKRMREKQRELIDSLDLTQYAIQTAAEDDEEWTSAMDKAKNKGSAVISLKNPNSTKLTKKRKQGSVTAEELAQQQQQQQQHQLLEKAGKKLKGMKASKKANRPKPGR